MPSEPLHIFDPRRNLQLQGFAGRAATTTLHDATETGVSISGIFQAAEDFAVLGWWNAYDYYNHLRLKHLPKTDLSGLKLEFDIEYDQTLDGAMRFDAAKFPSVSWDAMTFVTGVGDTHDVRLLDYATVVSGSETAATVFIDISGDENMDGGIDWLHLYFRDTRFTVTSTDCRVETQLTADVNAGDASLPVQNTAGFSAADGIWIERAGTNEEQTTVAGVLSNSLTATVSMDHPNGSFVTRKTKAWHVAQKLADIINTAGASVAGRFGPDQSGVIQAQAWASGPSTGGITITFVLASGTTARYGKLGNLDRVFLAHGRTLSGVPVGSGQGFQWSAGSGTSLLFANGDNNTKYHVTFDFTQPLLDKLGAVVPMSDCRKMYMVFAPRFENVEQDLQDGCFLTAGVGTSDTTWTVDDTSKLTGGRYLIGTPTSEERIQLLSVVSATQINVTRGFEASTPGVWSAGARLKKVSPVSGFNGDVEWGCAISNITITGNGSLKVGGGSDRIEEADPRCKYTGFQLPPNWEVDLDRLRSFLDALPPGHQYAFEFRNPTWHVPAVYAELGRHNAACCPCDLAGFQSPIEITADFTYVRLHGPGGKYQGSYSDEALGVWAERIRNWRKELKGVYVYFDNDEVLSAKEQLRRNLEALRQSPDVFFREFALPAQNLRDNALDAEDVEQILLFEAMLFHKMSQHRDRRRRLHRVLPIFEVLNQQCHEL